MNEAESEVLALCLSFLSMQAIVYQITGILCPLESLRQPRAPDDPIVAKYYKTADDYAYLRWVIITCFFLFLLVLLVLTLTRRSLFGGKKLSRADSATKENVQLALCYGQEAQRFLGLLGAWGTARWWCWWWRNITRTHIGAALCNACQISFLSLVLIIVVDFLAERKEDIWLKLRWRKKAERKNKGPISEMTLRTIIEVIGFLVGICWESAFSICMQAIWEFSYNYYDYSEGGNPLRSQCHQKCEMRGPRGSHEFTDCIENCNSLLTLKVAGFCFGSVREHPVWSRFVFYAFLTFVVAYAWGYFVVPMARMAKWQHAFRLMEEEVDDPDKVITKQKVQWLGDRYREHCLQESKTGCELLYYSGDKKHPPSYPEGCRCPCRGFNCYPCGHGSCGSIDPTIGKEDGWQYISRNDFKKLEIDEPLKRLRVVNPPPSCRCLAPFIGPSRSAFLVQQFQDCMPAHGITT